MTDYILHYVDYASFKLNYFLNGVTRVVAIKHNGINYNSQDYQDNKYSQLYCT